MILIFIPEITERWSYTLNFIFGLRAIGFQITDSHADFEASKGLKYSLQNSDLGVILNENAITKSTISSATWREMDCLSFNGVSDPISSIFYVLTRMEEYNNLKWDKHNRFEAKSSIQFKYNWLDKSICDRWANGILQEIEKEVNFNFKSCCKEVEIIPTFDIDNSYAYKLKTGKRKFLSIAKDLVKMNLTRLAERKSVVSGKKSDPYDSYDKIEEIAQNFSVRLFWLMGDYGNFDKNISIDVPAHAQLIRKMGAHAEIGIHPSYMSNSVPIMVKTEKERLEKSIGKKVRIARQHFLKLKFPQTYQNLISQGIQEDYTMGFADGIGFRNGTAHAYPWFDLSTNTTTKLLIRPFAYMDGTLNEYLNLSPDLAKEKIKNLHHEILQFGGDFIFLWHNETIGEYGIWKGWRTVLDYTLSLKPKS